MYPKKGHAFKARHCDGTVKSGKVSIMVWACFSGDKVGPLIVCDAGNVNADQYLEILEELSMLTSIWAKWTRAEHEQPFP